MSIILGNMSHCRRRLLSLLSVSNSSSWPTPSYRVIFLTVTRQSLDYFFLPALLIFFLSVQTKSAKSCTNVNTIINVNAKGELQLAPNSSCFYIQSCILSTFFIKRIGMNARMTSPAINNLASLTHSYRRTANCRHR